MKPRIPLFALSIAISAVLLSACDVDVEDKGKLPKVDVDVMAEKGRLPDIEVRGQDVEVGEKKIDIPDSITVPTIDVKTPKENEG